MRGENMSDWWEEVSYSKEKDIKLKKSKTGILNAINNIYLVCMSFYNSKDLLSDIKIRLEYVDKIFKDEQNKQ
jgi:hypothetical protein